MERREKGPFRTLLVHGAAADDGLAEAGLVHQPRFPRRGRPLRGIDLLHVVHEVEAERPWRAGVEGREDARFSVGADPVRALKSRVAEELDHQAQTLLAADVFGGDGGLPDPVLDTLDRFVVAFADLVVDRSEVLGSERRQGSGRGAGKGAFEDGTAGVVGHALPSA